MATKKDYVVGSGNVFADLGYARPEEAAAKAELAHKITKIIERRKLTQAEAANVLEVDQPKVSALKRGKLSGFSLDRLVRFLVLLGSDVEIVVKSQPRSRRRNMVLSRSCNRRRTMSINRKWVRAPEPSMGCQRHRRKR